VQQLPDIGRIKSARWDFLSLLVLIIAVFLSFLTSPRAGDFWWSDAPRHAMDGVFYYDLACSLPLVHLKQWAMNYYIQYPATTVLFYPPLFAWVEALFFSVFGVSHNTAQLTVSAFLLATASGAYFLARRWVARVAALSTALLLIGTPTMALWGRQVMLEIPAFAFLMWSTYFFFRYLDSAKAGDLYWVVGFVLAATYTKQSTVFIAVVYLLTLSVVHRRTLFQRREVWRSAALFCVGIAPLALFTWFWGRLNVQQAMGGSWVENSRTTLSGWFYVARQWPRQVGWAVLALALVYAAGATLRKEWRLPRPAGFFFAAWVLTGYVFFTLIALKLERYTIFLIFPLVFFSVLAIVRVLPGKVAPFAAVVVAVSIFANTLFRDHVPHVSGYRTAAQYVCSIAPPNSVILFSGLRDGSFVFNIRALPQCKDLSVIRSDKLLLMVQGGRRMFGVKELGVSEDELNNLVGRYGVRYVVLEPSFWIDLQSMQMLVRALHRDQYQRLTTIPITGDRERDESHLEIYQNVGPVSQEKRLIRFDLPAFGIAVQGEVGQPK